MGRDFTLSNNHPSIIINETKYHYGIDTYRQYMVETHITRRIIGTSKKGRTWRRS